MTYWSTRYVRSCKIHKLLEKNTWRRLIIKTTHKKSPITRYAHSSFILGDYIYVFGGFSWEEGCLNDLCFIDMKSVQLFHNEPTKSDSSFMSDTQPEEQIIVEFQKVKLSEAALKNVPCPRSAHSFSLIKQQSND